MIPRTTAMTERRIVSSQDIPRNLLSREREMNSSNIGQELDLVDKDGRLVAGGAVTPRGGHPTGMPSFIRAQSSSSSGSHSSSGKGQAPLP